MIGLGEKIYNLAEKLFPICRSITGNGVRESLRIIQKEIPELKILEIPSGEKCFDWIVPKEWNIRDAYILDPQGKKIVNFKDSNLHVMGYSTPIHGKFSLDELQENLYSIPEQPTAIPYITSYYKERWGFCLSQQQRDALKPGEYEVLIDSTLQNGSLSLGEIILPGESTQEVLLSTYICHPSLANDNLSGMCVTTYLAKWLISLPRRHYTYRIIFVPETIGSIAYLSRNLKLMKKNIIAGFNIACVGDDKTYSYLPSRNEGTLADKIAIHTLNHLVPSFCHYSFLDRESDERQYCSPNVDLPIVSIMRSKHGKYPEYHTSLDNLELISSEGLNKSYELFQKCIECLEANEYLALNCYGEPQLGKRQLYPSVSTRQNLKQVNKQIYDLLNLITYCDGKTTLLDIADKIKVPMWDLFSIVARLKQEGLISVVRFPIQSSRQPA